MALRRFRAVQFATHYGVIDHGEPVAGDDGEVRLVTIGRGVQGAGEQVPLYEQDGDPEDPATRTTVVWRAPDLSPESRDAAHAEADRLNEQAG